MGGTLTEELLEPHGRAVVLLEDLIAPLALLHAHICRPLLPTARCAIGGHKKLRGKVQGRRDAFTLLLTSEMGAVGGKK
eukprot:scaffold103585_cov19-Tisochrysis_lutea.AAC.2